MACAGALVALFALYNLISQRGRPLAARREGRRDRGGAVRLVRVGRTQTLAFIVSAGCAGLGGALPRPSSQLASPGHSRSSCRCSCWPGWSSASGRCRRGLGCRAARAPAELDQRSRPLVLAADQGVGEPAAGDLRARADRGDAPLAERDPGRAARDRRLRPPSVWRPRRGRSPRELASAGLDAEQRGLDLAETLPVATDPDRRVVVQERVGQPDDRVRERARFGGRVVPARPPPLRRSGLDVAAVARG